MSKPSTGKSTWVDERFEVANEVGAGTSVAGASFLGRDVQGKFNDQIFMS
jgi:hypothetical protein